MKVTIVAMPGNGCCWVGIAPAGRRATLLFHSVFSAPFLTGRLALVGVTLASTLLTACYVVPINCNPPVTTVYVTPSAPAPSTMTFAARLYPANDVAAAYGVVNAIVTNDLNGCGVFTTNINGETFNGEATRVDGRSARTGVANGAGNRGWLHQL